MWQCWKAWKKSALFFKAIQCIWGHDDVILFSNIAIIFLDNNSVSVVVDQYYFAPKLVQSKISWLGLDGWSDFMRDIRQILTRLLEKKIAFCNVLMMLALKESAELLNRNMLSAMSPGLSSFHPKLIIWGSWICIPRFVLNIWFIQSTLNNTDDLSPSVNIAMGSH